MSACSAALGGAGPFTGFFVKMCERAVTIGRKAKGKYVFLQRDIVDQVLDNAPLWKAFKKNMDARRKPPISQFVIAHLTGVTYSAALSAVLRPYCHILSPIVPSREEDGACGSSSAMMALRAFPTSARARSGRKAERAISIPSPSKSPASSMRWAIFLLVRLAGGGGVLDVG